ncbi:hypothetical protein PS15m_012306 [Mucor circinelloides]
MDDAAARDQSSYIFVKNSHSNNSRYNPLFILIVYFPLIFLDSLFSFFSFFSWLLALISFIFHLYVMLLLPSLFFLFFHVSLKHTFFYVEWMCLSLKLNNDYIQG